MSDTPKPPQPYQTWLDCAVDMIDVREVEFAQYTPRSNAPDSGGIRQAAAAELAALRAERDRLRVLLERARGVCTCHATMRPDIKCLSCAIAEELMK